MYKMASVLIFIYCHCENGSMYSYKALKYCLFIYFWDRKINLRVKNQYRMLVRKIFSTFFEYPLFSNSGMKFVPND